MGNNMKNKLLFMFFFLSLGAFAFAGGTELYPLNSSKTLSLNGLYFAGGGGVVNSISNPAALIFVEDSGIEFSISNRLAQNKFEGGKSGLYRSFRNDEYMVNGGVYYSISENVKVGLSYQPSLKYNVEWPYANYFDLDTLNSLIVFDFFNRLTVEAFSPSAAFRFNNITIGIAPVAYKITYKTAFPKSNPAWTGSNSAGYQFEYDQDGWAYGFSFGAIAQLNPEMRLAVSVRSGYSSDLEGTGNSKMFLELDSTDSNVNVSSKIEVPWIIGAGALYTISPEITVNLDMQYALWGSIQKSIDFSFNNNIWQQRLSGTDELTGITGSTFNLSYKNTFDLGAGIEYQPGGSVSYRFAYRYSQSPNSSSTYNMLFPSVDQHWISAGFGLTEENFVLDGTVAYGFAFSKSVSSNINNLNGKYGYSVVIPSVSLKYLIR